MRRWTYSSMSPSRQEATTMRISRRRLRERRRSRNAVPANAR
jgi:hypothetical protein